MRFIGQILLSPELGFVTAAQMAYLFITDVEELLAVNNDLDETWNPVGGENAILLQPGRVTVPTMSIVDGPSLYRVVGDPWAQPVQHEECEFAVDLIEDHDVEFLPEDERWSLSEEKEAPYRLIEETKIGGTPMFVQGDDFPFTTRGQLLLQLNSEGVPFHIEFGDAGVGYGFLNDTGDEALFCWQCG